VLSPGGNVSGARPCRHTSVPHYRDFISISPNFPAAFGTRSRPRGLLPTFHTRHRVDVANAVPPQSAAQIAIDSGLAGRSGCVQADPRSFEARSGAPGVHVVGDANNGAPMPTSGSVANGAAKQAVASAAAALRGEPPPEAIDFDTRYSHVGEGYGISAVNVYRTTGAAIAEVPNSGGVSLRGDMPEQRRLKARYADAWYASITRDMFS
jgi:sulfide dehydrogenase [flavocytochrome c] flavoprotein chain